MKKFKFPLLASLLFLMAPSGYGALNRFGIEVYGQQAGSRTRTEANKSADRLEALAVTQGLQNDTYTEKKTYGAVGVKFFYLVPTKFHDIAMGGSIGGGMGPSYRTNLVLEDSAGGSGLSHDEVKTQYMSFMYEAEKRFRFFRFFTASLKGGVGGVWGNTRKETRYYNSFADEMAESHLKQGYSGVVVDFVPSIGLALGKFEARLGVGLRYLPKTDSSAETGQLDSSLATSSLSISW